MATKSLCLLVTLNNGPVAYKISVIVCHRYNIIKTDNYNSYIEGAHYFVLLH
jgi:hypothetical protein